MEAKLQLDFIAARLEGLEETIITRFIDRVQYKANPTVYQKGLSGFQGADNQTLLEIRLKMQEEMDVQFGRYRQPEERPFTENVGQPKRKVVLPDTTLTSPHINKVNVTSEILESYIKFVSQICCEGDDRQYGSSVVADVYALQAIAERVHYGAIYVAEVKYRGDPKEYQRLIDLEDVDAIMTKLTRKEVEEKIIKRVRDKVCYLQTEANTQVRRLVDPDAVVEYYRKFIIPLTKEGEIQYLMTKKSV